MMHRPVASMVQVGAITPNESDTPTKKLENIKDKHADHPAKKRTTAICIHVLPLLNCHCWIQHIFKNICIRKMFCAMLQSTISN